MVSEDASTTEVRAAQPRGPPPSQPMMSAAQPMAPPQPMPRRLPVEKLYERDEDQQRKDVAASWSNRIVVDSALEQDHMEGVAEEEWMDDA